ncbi:hypothetical protein [Bradyrhizobium prioriisuperbiae]|uniref:hypothetical protein n=1 Tax=Bradyrhizobium prioriisuperbiae TaxID=2854389 RepID=UPI0028E76F03|nr:hypothetical protein [Bradyrhizobium prioritasuperba]
MRARSAHINLAQFVSALFFACCSQIATAAESSFYSQCHKLLPVANEFARECQQRARSFSRTFYPGGGTRGEVESYSTYFRPLDAPSHFVLGCVLDFKHKINFAGLYYTAQPLDMSHFDEYKIVFVSPDDAVGLEIEGVQNTLVPVRQFVTDIVPPRLTGRPKNCEEHIVETTKEAVATGYERIRQLADNKFEVCHGIGGDNYCARHEYSFFVEKHQAPVVYIFDLDSLFFIDGNGAFIAKEKFYSSSCRWKKDSTSVINVIHEMCARPNQSTEEK